MVERALAKTNRRPPVPTARPAKAVRPRGVDGLLALQRSAGNRATIHLLSHAGVVQRCGGTGCDCEAPEGDRATGSGVPQRLESYVQRANDSGTPASAQGEAAPGERYRIRRGDTLFGVTSRAYGVDPGPDRLALARVINDEPANRPFHTDDIPGSERAMFGGSRISFLPRFACPDTRKGGRKSGCFAMITIPPDPRMVPPPAEDDGSCATEAAGSMTVATAVVHPSMVHTASGRERESTADERPAGERCPAPPWTRWVLYPDEIQPWVGGQPMGVITETGGDRVKLLRGDIVELLALLRYVAVSPPVHWDITPADAVNLRTGRTDNPLVVAVSDMAGEVAVVEASAVRWSGTLIEPARLTLEIRDPTRRGADATPVGCKDPGRIEAAADAAARMADQARARLLADPELHDPQLVKLLREILGQGWLWGLKWDRKPKARPVLERRRQRRRERRRRIVLALGDNLAATRNAILRDSVEYHCLSHRQCGQTCDPRHRDAGGCVTGAGNVINICRLGLKRPPATIIHEAAHLGGVNSSGDEAYFTEPAWSSLGVDERLTMASAVEFFATRIAPP